MIRMPVLLALLVLAQPGDAIDPSVRPAEFVKDCLTSGCHSDVVSAKVLHGPTAAGACVSCHKYESEEKHTFRLAGKDRQMCGFCHVAQAAFAAPTVHQPVANGQCLVCHNPHGSASHGLPRTGNIRTQCLECHAGITAGMKHVHTPVEKTPCTVCHSPHTSSHPNLLSEEPSQLCVGCHAEVLEQARTSVVATESSGELPHAMPGQGDHVRVHAGQIESCETCHLTHASDHQSLLREEPVQVCATCHQDIVSVAKAATVEHSVVTSGQACMNCHSPHGSPIGALMKDNPTKTCLTCHDKPMKRPDGTPVGEVAEMESAKYKHGAVREGRCRGCHEVHGSDHRSLLTKAYTPAFYQPFQLDAYALCFQCHDSELVLDKATETTTNFRNGSRNLHFVHVVATKSPGRTCRACHETHTSQWPRLMASSVPYGEWKIPIQFKQTETGGSCAAGCHRSRSYDRMNPVEQESP